MQIDNSVSLTLDSKINQNNVESTPLSSQTFSVEEVASFEQIIENQKQSETQTNLEQPQFKKQMSQVFQNLSNKTTEAPKGETKLQTNLKAPDHQDANLKQVDKLHTDSKQDRNLSSELTQPNKSTSNLKLDGNLSSELTQLNKSTSNLKLDGNLSSELTQPNKSTSNLKLDGNLSSELTQPNKSTSNLKLDGNLSSELTQPNKSTSNLKLDGNLSSDLKQTDNLSLDRKISHLNQETKGLTQDTPKLNKGTAFNQENTLNNHLNLTQQASVQTSQGKNIFLQQTSPLFEQNSTQVHLKNEGEHKGISESTKHLGDNELHTKHRLLDQSLDNGGFGSNQPQTQIQETNKTVQTQEVSTTNNIEQVFESAQKIIDRILISDPKYSNSQAVTLSFNSNSAIANTDITLRRDLDGMLSIVISTSNPKSFNLLVQTQEQILQAVQQHEQREVRFILNKSKEQDQEQPNQQ